MATKQEIKDIVDNLLNKKDNEDAIAYIEQKGISDDEVVKASEINALAQEVIDHRDGVKKIHFNGVDYLPDTEGKVSFAYTAGGASYESVLLIRESLTANYAVAEKKFVVGVRYSSVVTSTTGQQNAGITGTLTISRSTNGTTWTKVGEVAVTSYDYDSAYSGTEYQEVDLSQYLDINTKYYFQLGASFSYTDPSTLQTTKAYSPNKIFSGGINYINLTLNYKSDWSKACTGNIFPLDFYLTGRVEKVLHIVVDNTTTLPAKTYSVDEEYPVTGSGLSITDFTKTSYPDYFTSNKVHQIESWLSCSDGVGGTIESEHQINQILYVADTTDTTNYIVVQNIKTSVINYVYTSNFLKYAIIVPALINSAKTKDVEIKFKFTDYSKLKEYAIINDTTETGSKNTISNTIEIESLDSSVQVDSYAAFLRAYIDDESVITYYDKSISQESIDYISITVDNKSNYVPTPDADFYLNPKTRSNSEANPRTIINAKTGEILKDSALSDFNTTASQIFNNMTFENDGWVVNSTDNQRVLRVLSGASVVIPYDVFSAFRTDNKSSTTIEIDFATRNLNYKGEEQAIFSIGSYTKTGTLRGLEMKPLDGLFYKFSQQNSHDYDFHWQEDTRTHLMINIRNAVTAKEGTSAMSLVKIFINGIICREFKYTPQEDEFYDGVINPIVIGGNSACDIDIYGIRCYKKDLADSDCMQNYKSSLPTALAKTSFKEANDITISGEIAYTLAKEKYNCLVWYGDAPNAISKGDTKGYLHLDVLNAPEYSGNICASSKSLPAKGQGTTAKTYYWWNQQYTVNKSSGTINVLFTNVHKDFGWLASDSNFKISEKEATEDTPLKDRAKYPMYYEGTQIQGSAYEGLSEDAKLEVTITVPDGWIDGNNNYRGQQYLVREDVPYAQKLVLKINYASSMQSHKQGCTELYNDLYRAIVTSAPLTSDKARVSVLEKPFLYFVQTSTDSQPIFMGVGTFGSGKCDKLTWGFDKSKHALLEGSKNNEPLTDMLVPFDHNVTYNEEEEYFEYAGQGNLDDDWQNVESSGFRPRIEEIFNFLYEHNPNIQYYDGTKVQFDSGYMPDGTTTLDTAAKYWFTSQAGSEWQYKLMRYHWVDRGKEGTEAGQWVNAGFWDEETQAYKVLDLSQSDNEDIKAAVVIANPETANTKIKEAIVAEAKEHIDEYVNADSLKFHYAFVNMFLAGSDNCSKNTYYFFNKDTNKLELHQDDLDTVLATDNNGWQIKKYFTDRYHDQSDKDSGYTSEIFYEGKNNVLFNLCEAMWENTLELRQMMWNILYQMCKLVDNYNTKNNTNYTVSPWGCMQKYFFDIQEYFPAIAYNETARLRYEYPEALGYNAKDAGGRDVAPITQSLGNQLESEKEFIRKRLILYASYASFGEFGQRNTTYVGNVFSKDEFINSFGFTASARPSGEIATFKLNVKPSQVLYLNYTNDSQQYHTHNRMVPFTDTTYPVTLGTSSSTSSSGNAMALYGADFFTSYGNLGDLSVAQNSTFSVSGKRLTELEIIPTDFDTIDDVQTPLFRARNLVITSPRLQSIACTGCSTVTGTLDLSEMTLLESFDISDTAITSVILPTGEVLKSISLPATLTTLTIGKLPNLKTIKIQGVSQLASLVLAEGVSASQTLFNACFGGDAPLRKLSVTNVNWTSMKKGAFTYLMNIKDCDISGKFALDTLNTDNTPTFIEKLAWLAKWGNVDDENNSVYIYRYTQSKVQSITVTGDPTTFETGDYVYTVNSNPTSGNDVSNLEWELETNVYASIKNYSANTCTINVKALGSEEVTPTAKLTCRLTKADGTVLEGSMTIRLYCRTAQLGDIVFADGTYGAELVTGKTPVGVCFYINPTDPTDRRMIGVEKLYDYADEYQCSTNGLGSPQYGNPYFSIFTLTDEPGYNCFDIASLPNLAESGLTNNTTTICPDTYLDENTVDGFKHSTIQETIIDYGIANPGVFDGKAELPADLVSLATGEEEGTRLPRGRIDTLKIIKHRNKILTDSGIDREVPMASDGETELNALKRCTSAIRSDLGSGYQQLYYFATSAAYAYQPVAGAKEKLSEKFKSHHWYLPSIGEVVRMLWPSLRGGSYTGNIGNIYKNASSLLKSFPNWGWMHNFFSSTERNKNCFWGKGAYIEGDITSSSTGFTVSSVYKCEGGAWNTYVVCVCQF